MTPNVGFKVNIGIIVFVFLLYFVRWGMEWFIFRPNLTEKLDRVLRIGVDFSFFGISLMVAAVIQQPPDSGYRQAIDFMKNQLGYNEVTTILGLVFLLILLVMVCMGTCGKTRESLNQWHLIQTRKKLRMIPFAIFSHGIGFTIFYFGMFLHSTFVSP